MRVEIIMIGLISTSCGCMPAGITRKANPSKDYVRSIGGGGMQSHYQPTSSEGVPRVKWTGDPGDELVVRKIPIMNEEGENQETVGASHLHDRAAIAPRSMRPTQPTVNPSLWRHGHGRGGLYHDLRAWRPMDLITIIVQENTEGRKESDTLLNTNTSLQAAITRFLGIEASVGDRNTQLSPSALVDATAQTNFQGEGETVRRGSLTGAISAMVVEVLPSGILYIEGKKIISVNSEEQVMVISGLVRPRDIASGNQVQSSRIANMRIDYFGKGLVNDVQTPGIVTQLFYKLWPF